MLFRCRRWKSTYTRKKQRTKRKPICLWRHISQQLVSFNKAEWWNFEIRIMSTNIGYKDMYRSSLEIFFNWKRRTPGSRLFFRVYAESMYYSPRILYIAALAIDVSIPGAQALLRLMVSDIIMGHCIMWLKLSPGTYSKHTSWIM